jgi:hypothetical protein
MSDHCGWAVLVTVAPDGRVVDRRRVELIDADLPRLPHHHDAQLLAREAGVELIERVTASAKRHARKCLDTLAADIGAPITAIAIRRCPPLPPTIAERLTDYRAQNVADTVMYRDAVAEAAAAIGWSVSWFEVKSVFEAARARKADLDRHIRETGKALGSPWQKDHRVAMAAAIAATW